MVGTMKADWGWSSSGIAQETISGGQFVKAMSQSSTDVALLLTNAVLDGALTVGIALNNATSGNRLGVCHRGIWDMHAHAAIVAGNPVMIQDANTDADAVIPMGSIYSQVGSHCVGRAITSAASGDAVRCIIDFVGAGGGA